MEDISSWMTHDVDGGAEIDQNVEIVKTVSYLANI
jgi:hypothetical protein